MTGGDRAEEVCRHCGDPIRRGDSGEWAHVTAGGSLLYNCQHTVPYGQVAEALVHNYARRPHVETPADRDQCPRCTLLAAAAVPEPSAPTGRCPRGDGQHTWECRAFHIATTAAPTECDHGVGDVARRCTICRGCPSCGSDLGGPGRLCPACYEDDTHRAAPTEPDADYVGPYCIRCGCLDADHPNPWCPAAPWCGPTEGAGETLLDVQAANLRAALAANTRLRAERDALRDTVRRIEALADQWTALAPADDWGESMSDTVLADAGRALRAALVPPSTGDARRETADSLDDGEPGE